MDLLNDKIEMLYAKFLVPSFFAAVVSVVYTFVDMIAIGRRLKTRNGTPVRNFLSVLSQTLTSHRRKPADEQELCWSRCRVQAVR